MSNESVDAFEYVSLVAEDEIRLCSLVLVSLGFAFFEASATGDAAARANFPVALPFILAFARSSARFLGV